MSLLERKLPRDDKDFIWELYDIDKDLTNSIRKIFSRVELPIDEGSQGFFIAIGDESKKVKVGLWLDFKHKLESFLTNAQVKYTRSYSCDMAIYAVDLDPETFTKIIKLTYGGE